MIQHKSFDLSIKAGDDPGGFVAYVAAFGNIDRAAEIIEPGAFKNLPSFAVDGWVGVNHDMGDLPVAIVETATQDARGLKLAARWHSTPKAQACRAVVNERLAAGKSVKCSIGYKVLDSFKDSVDGRPVTRLTALDLFEASIVNLPANPAASVIAAKSHAEKVLTLESLQAWLDAETKAGRVLSRANHSKLREWHGSLAAMCDQIKEMVDTYDPDMDDDDDKTESSNPPPQKSPDGDGCGSVAGKAANQLRAALLRAQLSLANPHI
jgi:HK97 family phage prohead protease